MLLLRALARSNISGPIFTDAVVRCIGAAPSRRASRTAVPMRLLAMSVSAHMKTQGALRGRRRRFAITNTGERAVDFGVWSLPASSRIFAARRAELLPCSDANGASAFASSATFL